MGALVKEGVRLLEAVHRRVEVVEVDVPGPRSTGGGVSAVAVEAGARVVRARGDPDRAMRRERRMEEGGERVEGDGWKGEGGGGI